jgi:hypothetical protein
MGGYQLVNKEVKNYEEPVSPGWFATSREWQDYEQLRKSRPEHQVAVLTLHDFQRVIAAKNVEFPKITAAEINDRSKGDGLAKLIAILQTSWFIAQCIARTVQNLAITKLELVALAMASLNAVTYVFWWSKPLGVQQPVNIYVTRRPRVEVGHGPEVREELRLWEIISKQADALTFIFNPLRDTHFSWIPFKWRISVGRALGLYLVGLPYSLFFILTFPVFVLFPLSISCLRSIIKTKNAAKSQGKETVATRVLLTLRRLLYKVTHSIRQSTAGSLQVMSNAAYDDRRFIKNWFFVLPGSFIFVVLILLILSPLFALFFIASFTFTAIFEIVTTSTVPPNATHVPPFYAPCTYSDRYSRMVVFALFGAIFGGIHCIGWIFDFPTPIEKLLWRYTAVALTAIPLIAAPIDCVLENIELEGRFSKKLRTALDIFMTVLLFAYVPARLCLIALALASLRDLDQPPSAFVAVDWTQYIPHL